MTSLTQVHSGGDAIAGSSLSELSLCSIALAALNNKIQNDGVKEGAEASRQNAYYTKKMTEQEAHSIRTQAFEEGIGASITAGLTIGFTAKAGFDYNSKITDAENDANNIKGFKNALNEADNADVLLVDENGGRAYGPKTEAEQNNIDDLMNKDLSQGVAPTDQETIELMNDNERTDFEKKVNKDSKDADKKLENLNSQKEHFIQKAHQLYAPILKGFNSAAWKTVQSKVLMVKAEMQYLEAMFRSIDTISQHIVQTATSAASRDLDSEQQLMNALSSLTQSNRAA